jgi:hypothetical protein
MLSVAASDDLRPLHYPELLVAHHVAGADDLADEVEEARTEGERYRV